MLGMVLPAGKKRAAIHTTYNVNRSIRTSVAAASALTRTFVAPTNADVWTWDGWIKLGAVGTRRTIFDADAGGSSYFELQANNTFCLFHAGGTYRTSVAVLRDPTAYYHLTVSFNRANAAADQIKVYLNGNLLALTGVTAIPAAFYLNTAVNHAIGRNLASAAYWEGNFALVRFVDGLELLPTSFAEADSVTGQWVPKDYTGAYGNNGFRLDFADNSSVANLGLDTSGKLNHWTPVGFSIAADQTNDSLLDSPTDFKDVSDVVHSNFPILSTDIALNSVGAVSRGGLQWQASGVNSAIGTFVARTDDPNIYYFEMKFLASADCSIAVGPPNPATGALGYSTADVTRGAQYRSLDGKVWSLNVQQGAIYATFANNDTVGLAFQASTGKVWAVDKTGAIVNGGAPVMTFPTPRDLCPGVSGGTSAVVCSVNFGQQPFKYPTAFATLGAKRMCNYNLAEPATPKPVAKAISYPGSAAVIAIAGLGFKPALVIIKQTTAIAGRMFADINAAPDQPWDTGLGTARLAAVPGFSFDPDGFTLPANIASISTNGGQFTAFAFAKSALAGLDIVTWVGNGVNSPFRQIAHALATTPDCIFIRCHNAAVPGVYTETPVWWRPYSDPNMVVTWGGVSNSGTGDDTYYPGGASATMFEVGSNFNVNGNTYVAFVFSNREGRSRAAYHVGNGNASGARVGLGFKPAFCMVKKINPTGTGVLGSHIPGYALGDPNPLPVGPNMFSNDAILTQANALDRLSDGVKFRANDTTFNGTGADHGLLAFAARSQKYARAA